MGLEEIQDLYRNKSTVVRIAAQVVIRERRPAMGQAFHWKTAFEKVGAGFFDGFPGDRVLPELSVRLTEKILGLAESVLTIRG